LLKVDAPDAVSRLRKLKNKSARGFGWLYASASAFLYMMSGLVFIEDVH
jgi:hypothetical protein